MKDALYIAKEIIKGILALLLALTAIAIWADLLPKLWNF